MRPDDWGAIVDGLIAQICLATGWTWDYCEEALTMPRLKALTAEYGRALGPPPRTSDGGPPSRLARPAMPHKPPSPRVSSPGRPQAQGDLEELAALFANGVVR